MKGLVIVNNVERKAYSDKIAKLSINRLKQMHSALIEEAELIKGMIYNGHSSNVDEDWETVRELEVKAYIIEIELEFR